MKKSEFKIKTTDQGTLLFFFLSLFVYIGSLYIVWDDWDKLNRAYGFRFGISLLLLIGLYFINYILYLTTNKIEVNYDSFELKEKVLNFTLYTININEIQKIYHDFPYIACGFATEASELLMPNFKESANIEFMINNKFIRKNWYLGENNTNKVIRTLTDLNSAIKVSDKSFNPSSFAKKEIDFKDFKLVMLVSVPIIIALLLGLSLLQNN